MMILNWHILAFFGICVFSIASASKCHSSFGPQYLPSITPLLILIILKLSYVLDLASMCASYPIGSAIATPNGIAYVWNGSKSTSSPALKSIQSESPSLPAYPTGSMPGLTYLMLISAVCVIPHGLKLYRRPYFRPLSHSYVSYVARTEFRLFPIFFSSISFLLMHNYYTCIKSHK